ncbi:MAG: tRNA preQ1(34) S-adenosylmethionine ribosyltransferase-isomerase QueA [Pseudomonadota bacterium]
MKLEDFDFDLPEALIATRPVEPRTSARLMVAEADNVRDEVVAHLPKYLRAGDRLVLNDTRVIPARLQGVRKRQTGQGEAVAKVEATLLSPTAQGGWCALLKPLRKVQLGEVIAFGPDLRARLVGVSQGQAELAFNLEGAAFQSALNAVGAMPLPPYIAARRAPDEQDKTDYQTVWARKTGAVAAPTASLHFDDDLLAELRAQGVQVSFVTLHVGAGTFLPVKVDDVTQHKMHAEWGCVDETAARDIAATQAQGGRVIPVGTTALRLIETAARETGKVRAWEGDTDIFIYPGFEFRVTDALMTNFHLPKSTLMMLVAALMGQDRILELYAHAIAEKYRFFSYGDASLLIPQKHSD